MSVSILAVDDEVDVADLFRQHFRREVRQGQYVLHFACSAAEALDKLAKPSRDKLSSMRCRDRMRTQFLPQSSRASNRPTIDLRQSRSSHGPRCAIAIRPPEIFFQMPKAI